MADNQPNLSTSDDVSKVLDKGGIAIPVKSYAEPFAIVAKADEVLGKG